MSVLQRFADRRLSWVFPWQHGSLMVTVWKAVIVPERAPNPNVSGDGSPEVGSQPSLVT
jgi:hypothetical protein